MKKKLLCLWLEFFLVFWAIFMGAYFLFCKVRGDEFILMEKSIRAAVFSICITTIPVIMPACIFVIPRSKYLKNNDIAKPSFKVFYSSVVDIPQGYDFSRFKNEIAGKWVITFSDDTEKVLKCRTNFNFSNWSSVFSNWGTAAWMKYDVDAQKLYLECFPMRGVWMDADARKMQEEIEDCLKIT